MKFRSGPRNPKEDSLRQGLRNMGYGLRTTPDGGYLIVLPMDSLEEAMEWTRRESHRYWAERGLAQS